MADNNLYIVDKLIIIEMECCLKYWVTHYMHIITVLIVYFASFQYLIIFSHIYEL